MLMTEQLLLTGAIITMADSDNFNAKGGGFVTFIFVIVNDYLTISAS